MTLGRSVLCDREGLEAMLTNPLALLQPDAFLAIVLSQPE